MSCIVSPPEPCISSPLPRQTPVEEALLIPVGIGQGATKALLDPIPLHSWLTTVSDNELPVQVGLSEAMEDMSGKDSLAGLQELPG
eukprot:102093-Amphidinium_carterae.1